MQNINLLCNWLTFSLLVFSITPVHAQITPDNTLGAESSRITPNVLINGLNAERIDGGAQRNNNLFHSFSQFNINDGQRVYFGNPSGVDNILTRVTGGQISNILGTLGVDGTANLFLINPSGILFGENSRLDVRGSFVGTTANGVQFGSQGFFSATNPEAPALLTINPSALLFNQINSGTNSGTNLGTITNRSRPNATTDAANSSSFSPQQGSRFLVGGDITFDGGIFAAVSNRLELGAVKGVGAVGLIGSGNEMRLNFPEGFQLGDIALQNNSFAFTTEGGAITVHARNLSLTGNSFISSILGKAEGTPGVPSGDVVINAKDTVTLDNKSSIGNKGFEDSLGDTGNVTINAQSIRLNNSSLIATNGQKNRGNVSLNATEDITLDNTSLVTSFGTRTSIGKAGDISLTARRINLSNSASINSGNIGQGQGGKTTLEAQDTVSLSSKAGIYSGSGASIFGGVNREASGDIEIKARSLSLDADTTISSTNFDEGRAGDIQITTKDSISLDGATITSGTSGSGEGGDIQLQTRTLNLFNGGTIGTQTNGQGNSGNLLINASDSVGLSGSTTISLQDGKNFIIGSSIATSALGSGKGGQLSINTGRLSIRDGGNISTSVGIGKPGRGGDLSIKATDSVEVVGFIPNTGLVSGIRTSTLGSGDAGSLNITTPRLSVREGGTVNTATATNDSSGRGGNLIINASDLVEVAGLSPDGKFVSGISSGTSGFGDAGNMTINTGRLSIGGGALVETGTRSGSRGLGGNLTVNASEFVEVVGTGNVSENQFPGVLSTSTSGSGNAGNLTINTPKLSVRDVGIIETTANSGSTGQGGNLSINASDFVEVLGTSTDGKSSSTITASTFASGNAGSINITTNRLSVGDGGFISTDAREGTTGQGGSLTINASDVEIRGKSPEDIFNSSLSTSSFGSGNAGQLNITTNRLSISNGYISTATNGSGRGGDIDINTRESVEILANPTDTDMADAIFTSTSGSGDAGNLNIRTQRLNIRNGAFVGAGTTPSSTGKGGNILINAFNSVDVTGSSNDGRSQSLISVRSRGEGQAGNITVNSPLISLRNTGAINAESFANDGGNIEVNANVLLLRRGGNISATAGNDQAGGNGGNININAEVIAAVETENSDISANAFQGQGGNININTQAIFGIVPAAFPTLKSDITASSKLGIQGQVTINQPNVQDPQTVVELPEPNTDASNQIAQVCPKDSTGKLLGEFYIVGRKGSLPPSRFEPLAGTPSLSPLATLDADSSTDSNKIASTSPIPKLAPNEPTPIVEAQGFLKTPDGQVHLVAQAASATPYTPTSAKSCP
jgi:filamentous hemagglutinin family protein